MLKTRCLVLSLILATFLGERAAFELHISDVDFCQGLPAATHSLFYVSLDWRHGETVANLDAMANAQQCEAINTFYQEIVPDWFMAEGLAKHAAATQNQLALISPTAYIYSPRLRAALQQMGIAYEPKVLTLTNVRGEDDRVVQARKDLLRWASESTLRVGNMYTADLISKETFPDAWIHWVHMSSASILEKQVKVHPAILILTSLMLNALKSETWGDCQIKLRKLFDISRSRTGFRNIPSLPLMKKLFNNPHQERYLQRYKDSLMNALAPLSPELQAFFFGKYLLVLLHLKPTIFQSTKYYRKHCRNAILEWFSNYPPSIQSPMLLAEVVRKLRFVDSVKLFADVEPLLNDYLLKAYEQYHPTVPFPWLSLDDELVLWRKTVPSSGFFDASLKQTRRTFHWSELMEFPGEVNYIKYRINYHPRLFAPIQIVLSDTSQVECETLACVLNCIGQEIDRTAAYNMLDTDPANKNAVANNWARLLIMNILTFGHFNFRMPTKLIDALTVNRFDGMISNKVKSNVIRLMIDTDIWQGISPKKLQARAYQLNSLPRCNPVTNALRNLSARFNRRTLVY